MAGSPNLKINLPGQNMPVLTQQGTFSMPWYQAFIGFLNRTGGGAGIDSATLLQDDNDNSAISAMFAPVGPGNAPQPYAVTPGASPWTYQAPFAGFVSVQGGTVSAVALSGDGGSTYFTISGGLAPVLEGSYVKVTYTVAPTVTMIGA